MNLITAIKVIKNLQFNNIKSKKNPNTKFGFFKTIKIKILFQ